MRINDKQYAISFKRSAKWWQYNHMPPDQKADVWVLSGRAIFTCSINFGFWHIFFSHSFLGFRLQNYLIRFSKIYCLWLKYTHSYCLCSSDFSHCCKLLWNVPSAVKCPLTATTPAAHICLQSHPVYHRHLGTSWSISDDKAKFN